jgi:hypothetical protein
LILLLPFRRIARREDQSFKQGVVFLMVGNPAFFRATRSSPPCVPFSSCKQSPFALDGLLAQRIQSVPKTSRVKKIEKCWRHFPPFCVRAQPAKNPA